MAGDNVRCQTNKRTENFQNRSILMSTEIPSGSDSNSFDAIRSSLVAAWVVILIMILKTPSKTGLDFFLLFLAIVNLGPLLIGAVPKHRSVRPESLPPLF